MTRDPNDVVRAYAGPLVLVEVYQTALNEAGIGGGGEDALELLAELLACERRQLDQPCARVAAELGQQRPQRMAAMQLVRAVGPDHEHALAAERACQVGR